MQSPDKKSKLHRMKEKVQKIEGICNITFISGSDKSKINVVRYCLHQMTRETDKTQALMDFVRLVFKLESKVSLIWHGKEEDKDKNHLKYD